MNTNLHTDNDRSITAPLAMSTRRSWTGRAGRVLGAGAAAAALFAAVPTAAHADSNINVGVCATVFGVTTCPPGTGSPPVAGVSATVAVNLPAPQAPAAPAAPAPQVTAPQATAPQAPPAPVGADRGSPPVQATVAAPVLPVDVCANVAGVASAQVNDCPNGTPNPAGGALPVDATANADATAVVASPILAPAAPTVAGVDTVDTASISPSAIDAHLCLTGVVLAQNLQAACPPAPATPGTAGNGILPSVNADVCANVAVGAAIPAACNGGSGTGTGTGGNGGGVDVNACLNVAVGAAVPAGCTTAAGGATGGTSSGGSGTGGTSGDSGNGSGGAAGALLGQHLSSTPASSNDGSLPTTGIAVFGLLLLAGILIVTGAGTKAMALVTRRRQ